MFIDFDRLEAITRKQFLGAVCYPHAAWNGLLYPDAFEALVATLPPVTQLRREFGRKRRAGQYPHDRYALEYQPGTPVSDAWRGFIAELRSDRYRRNIARLLGAREVEFRFHWHYTPRSCSVSPHCDSRREWGSHLFYFNHPKSWDPAWGGETLVLDDGRRLRARSAPSFDDFDAAHTIECVGNVSALLATGAHHWHGVRELVCPEGAMRKVFIVVINPSSPLWRLRDRLIGRPKQRL
jgi:hypothetical protein